MDNRITYYLVLDVETANSLDDALVYDIGCAIVDKYGRTYATFSAIVREVFCDERELMKSAYYASKIPEYIDSIARGERRIMRFHEIRTHILFLMRKWNVKAVCAYNASFDINALNTTERWLSKSKYRFFFPYDTEIMCIWNMACQTICQRPTYKNFCEQHNLTSNRKGEPDAKNYSTSAETVYKYLTLNPDYTEEHKGLDDVIIEAYIMHRVFASHKAMPNGTGINRACWMSVKRD